jgi:uncharacterized membrane protein YqaE (UPF0057 family)
MNPVRLIVAILLPPLAVLDKGFKPVLITAILTFLGWVPGVVAALVYSSGPMTKDRI